MELTTNVPRRDHLCDIVEGLTRQDSPIWVICRATGGALEVKANASSI